MNPAQEDPECGGGPSGNRYGTGHVHPYGFPAGTSMNTRPILLLAAQKIPAQSVR
jgi:hypothetical protein